MRPPPKQRGTPEESTLQTSFCPSQQFCEALTERMPPSGSLPAPQMLPVPLQLVPLLQRPASHTTSLGEMLPQQAAVLLQKLPVSLQPPTGWQMVAP